MHGPPPVTLRGSRRVGSWDDECRQSYRVSNAYRWAVHIDFLRVKKLTDDLDVTVPAGDRQWRPLALQVEKKRKT